MTRSQDFNFHAEPVRTEMTGTQQIMISQILLTRANQRALSLMKALRRRANHKAFKKSSTQIKKNIQLMKQRTRNLRKQIIQSSMSQDIFTYSSVVKISLTSLITSANEHAWQYQGTSTIRKYLRP